MGGFGSMYRTFARTHVYVCGPHVSMLAIVRISHRRWKTTAYTNQKEFEKEILRVVLFLLTLFVSDSALDQDMDFIFCRVNACAVLYCVSDLCFIFHSFFRLRTLLFVQTKKELLFMHFKSICVSMVASFNISALILSLHFHTFDEIEWEIERETHGTFIEEKKIVHIYFY